MVTEKITTNATDLELELDWLKKILKTRSLLNCNKESEYQDVFDIAPPYFNGSASGYAQFVKEHELGFEERFLIILSIVPHIKPELLDVFLVRNDTTQQIFTEFGGRRGKSHNGFLPTGETVMFILAGTRLDRRFSLLEAFDGGHLFARKQILWLDEVEKGEPFLNGALTISQEALELFTTGDVRKPNYSADFPAKLLTTRMDWDDLVLNTFTRSQLSEIEIWLEHHHTLMKEWGMNKKLKPGYRTLFYGPPGTGKTLTASLLGKKIGVDVYRIDLSKVVSKYIGETEKNLAKIFDRAENKEWILFFDEAEALFGKRTNVSDAHDRYANQEVAYLLQRIEDYEGLVILASNLKSNLDDAFTRRFQTMIHFPMPEPEERMELWKKGFSDATELEDRIDLTEIAKKYNIAGGSIINVVQYCSLMALRRGERVIRLKDLIEGIRREYHKGSRTF
ncbi:MAG: ATP-binding protein [Bacteroidota bacterium]